MRQPGLVSVLRGWLWLGLSPLLPAAEFQATDTARLRFVGTTFGTNHVGPGQILPRLGRSAPDWAEPLLNRVAPGMGGRVVEFTTERPSLAFWFLDTDPNNRDGFRIPHLQPWPSFLPLNPDGIPMGTYTIPGRMGVWPMALAAWVYPRRQRELSFAFFRAEAIPNDHRLRLWRAGTLNLRNPAPFVGPSWLPQEMPASILANGRRYSVESVRVFREWGTNQWGARIMRNQTRAILGEGFRLPAEAQRVLQLTLDDATGNLIRLNRPSSAPSGPSYWWIEGSLFDDEKAWRLRAKLAPDEGSGAREQMVFTGLGLPKIVEQVNPASEDTSPWPAHVPAPPPPPQNATTIPGLAVAEVSITGFADGMLSISFQVLGATADALARVVRVEDARGTRWDAVVQEDSSPGMDQSQATFWSCVLRSSNLAQDSTPQAPLKAVIEVYTAQYLDFFVPPHFDPVGPPPGPVGESTAPTPPP